MKKLKLAVVKSENYPDLWVCDRTKNKMDIFKTSLMRCPSIGLLDHFDTEFIIVEDSREFPCKVYLHPAADELQNIAHVKENKYNTILPFLDDTYHKDKTIHEVAHNIDTIEWANYDIVITINACIPNKKIEQYPNVLWCYYISENEESFMQNKIDNYDVLLDQDVNNTNHTSFSIGFPYIFLTPNTLKNVHKQIFNKEEEKEEKEEKNGIFIEVNNTQERPVQSPKPEFKYISERCNIPLYVHHQNIVENLNRLCKSKYFIKIYGRVIRGNGVIEAISAGTLVLLNKKLITYNDLIPDECHVETPEDIINKIQYFENNNEKYNDMIKCQQQLLEERYVKKPIIDLYKKYYEKCMNQMISFYS